MKNTTQELVRRTRGRGTGSGQDNILAGNGKNIINGGNGQDIIRVGNGNNQIYVDTQVDLAAALDQQKTATASGQKGSFIAVGDGDNTIVGGNGNDAIFTGTGNNTIVCGPGSVTVKGGLEVRSVDKDWSPTTRTTFPVYDIGITGIVVESAPFNAPDPYTGGWEGSYETGYLPVGAGNNTIFGGTGDSVYILGNGNNWLDAGAALFVRIQCEAANDSEWRKTA
jgi:Ca2+-binding RTX toxin-like protein